MARATSRQPLQVSILDRLLDEDPGVTSEPLPYPAQQLRTLHQAVRRDLENLLNTRQRCASWSPELSELERSLVNYGLPDFTALNLASGEGREAFRRLIETAIRRHEPRFKTVNVRLLENVEPLDRTLRFRIDALLHAEPAPEPIVFDSILEPVTCSFALKGNQHER